MEIADQLGGDHSDIAAEKLTEYVAEGQRPQAVIDRRCSGIRAWFIKLLLYAIRHLRCAFDDRSRHDRRSRRRAAGSVFSTRARLLEYCLSALGASQRHSSTRPGAPCCRQSACRRVVFCMQRCEINFSRNGENVKTVNLLKALGIALCVATVSSAYAQSSDTMASGSMAAPAANPKAV